MPTPSRQAVLALDAGTTGVRSLVFGESAEVVAVAYRELTQHFPQPGWVEHDASEIWQLLEETIGEAAEAAHAAGYEITAVGITNQRETAVAWNRHSGAPAHRAIVWQDRRTAGRCDELREAGHLPLVRARTGLVLDSYFSATKWEWMLTEAAIDTTGLALGTVDTWVIWNLLGGTDGGALVTDVSNASRTLCFDIHARSFTDELCALFGVPKSALPTVVPSSGAVGRVSASVAGGVLAGVPVSGIAGDQQAALFGQCCFEEGETKVTYGTGTFLLTNTGTHATEPAEGLLTTIAWGLHGAGPGEPAEITYALEGAVFSSGAAIQWLRDGLGIIDHAEETGPLAESVVSTEGCYLVPAFAGLGSPWWDPYARGTLVGLTRGVGKAHVARAAVEAIAFQVRDVVDAMSATGTEVKSLRADGGASAMDLLLQLQADQIRVPVVRGDTAEATARGAAFLAGLASGVWSGLGQLRSLAGDGNSFAPSASQGAADGAYAGWLRAVARSRDLAG